MKGKQGMAITAAEYEAVAKKIVAAADRKLQAMLREASGRRKQQLQSIYMQGGWVLSLDRATYHQAADLNPIGVASEDIVWLAANSGDMHGIIEHRWGELDERVGEYMMAHPEVTDMRQLMQQIRDTWNSSITAEGVQKDFKKLVKVWQAVRDAGGARVARKLT